MLLATDFVFFPFVLQVDGIEELEAKQDTDEEQNLIHVTDITTDSR